MLRTETLCVTFIMCLSCTTLGSTIETRAIETMMTSRMHSSKHTSPFQAARSCGITRALFSGAGTGLNKEKRLCRYDHRIRKGHIQTRLLVACDNRAVQCAPLITFHHMIVPTAVVMDTKSRSINLTADDNGVCVCARACVCV